jgi:ATP-dependent helicase HrpA
LYAGGTPFVSAAFRRVADVVAPVSTELDKTLQALASAAKQPTAKLAIVDIRAQLERLFPPDLLATIPLARLQSMPRYLRAAQVRLGRAIADPRKDAEKNAPFAPLWSSFLAKQPAARDVESAVALRWAFEELRVAIFAPELKTLQPVSTAKIAAALAALR